MNVNFKLTRAEFTALAKMVAGMAHMWPKDDLADRLLRAILERFARDLVSRSFEMRQSYRLSLHPERAIAFACAIDQVTLNHAEFADNLALKMYNTIIQQLTT